MTSPEKDALQIIYKATKRTSLLNLISVAAETLRVRYSVDVEEEFDREILKDAAIPNESVATLVKMLSTVARTGQGTRIKLSTNGHTFSVSARLPLDRYKSVGGNVDILESASSVSDFAFSKSVKTSDVIIEMSITLRRAEPIVLHASSVDEFIILLNSFEELL